MYQRGLGFAPVIAGSFAGGPVGLAIGAAITLGLAILSRLHIGSGRKEADAITPVANSLTNPTHTGRLDEITDAIHSTSNVAELQNAIAELQWIKSEYDKFLSDPGFTDGRASQQARGDMFPLIDDMIDWIAAKIHKLGGLLPPPIVTQGNGTAIPQLTTPLQTFPFLPQGGTLPPNAPLSPLRAQQASYINAGFEDMLPWIAAAAIGYAVMTRRGRG